MEIADGMGFEILHGIVDCLWVKVSEPEKLCEIVSKEIGIPIELKGEFRWIIFLPNKSNGTGALNRYYGMMRNGRLKVRGIETRRAICQNSSATCRKPCSSGLLKPEMLQDST